MNKKTTCEITLLPNGAIPGVYHAGRELCGTVLLTMYQPKSVRGLLIPAIVHNIINRFELTCTCISLIVFHYKFTSALYIQIRGLGQSEWSVQRGSKTRIYLGKEQYFSHRTTFYETDDGMYTLVYDVHIEQVQFKSRSSIHHH